MKRVFCTLVAAMLVFTAAGCGAKTEPAAVSSNTLQKSIAQIDRMPDRPTNYKWRDYLDVAKKYDELVFSFASSQKTVATDPTTYMPLGFWDKSGVNATPLTPSFPSYIGRENNQEGVTVMGSVWGASIAGIDKSAQKFTDANGSEVTYNFIEMMKAYYNEEAEKSFVMNNKKQQTGHTFWYEVYPQIQFIRLHALYPDETWMRDIILEGAGYWHDALPNFSSDGEPDFVYVSYNFETDSPVFGSQWNEPPNGGLAMIFYTAYSLTGDEKYLEDCKAVLDYIETFDKSIYYEILQDYAPYIAAIMNERHGTNYNIAKFINYAFEGATDFRSATQVINAKWGDYDAYGLMGFGYSDVSGDGYAFAMNTFHMASTLMPLLKYDSRFADDLGKWMLHMTNSARIFYGDELPEYNASGDYDKAITKEMEYAVAYEGTKSAENYKGNGAKKPMTMGDPTIHGWGPTDLGLYGGGHVGLVGGIVEKTNVPEILKIDLNKNDSFNTSPFDSFLYYNPYNTEKTVTVNLDKTYKLHNGVDNAVIAESASGKYALKIPAKTSMILNLLPEGAEIVKDGKLFKVGTEIVYSDRMSLDIVSVTKPRTFLTRDMVTGMSGEDFVIDYAVESGDEATHLTISYGDKIIYDGVPVKSQKLNLKGCKTSVNELTVKLTTKLGACDTASIRVGIQMV